MRWLPWVAVAIACASFWGGFPDGHDARFELVRVAEYRESLAEGQLPPYWGSNLYAGYGSPIYLFYAPLFLAAASFFSLLTGAVPSGAVLSLIALTALSAWLTHKMLEATTDLVGLRDPVAARVGATFYVLHPYLLGDKFLRNANAEFTALCVAPLVLWGLVCAARRPRQGFALLSAGVALVIVAHNLTALAMVGLALVGAAWIYAVAGEARAWAVVGGGVAFGLALAAFFWVPALTLTSHVRVGVLLEGKLDFHNQFPLLRDVLGYDRFFAAGLVTPAALAASALAAARWKGPPGPGRRTLLGALMAALGFGFLVSKASTPVWEAIPLLPYFQFPWRMLGPQALVTSVALALAFALLTRGLGYRGRQLAEGVVLAVCLLNALPMLAQVKHFDSRRTEELAQILEPRTPPWQLYEATGGEYLPHGADPRVWQRSPARGSPVMAAEHPIEFEVTRDHGTRIELQVHSEAGSGLWMRRWAFPGWRAAIDGRAIPLSANEYGTVAVQMPPGESRLEVFLAPPAVRSWALIGSGLAFGAWLVVLWRWPRR